MMTEVSQLYDIDENGDWDHTPFSEQWPGLEGYSVGTGPSEVHEESRSPGSRQGPEENPAPSSTYSQEGDPSRSPSCVQQWNPLQGQKMNTVPVPFHGSWLNQQGKPVPGPLQRRDEKYTPSAWPGQEGRTGQRNPTTSPSNRAGNSTVDKRIKARTKFTPVQLIILEKAFSVRRFCSKVNLAIISRLLKLEEHVVQVWFQNRRVKEKKEAKKKEVSGIISPLGNLQPAHSTQNNHDNNEHEYSFTDPLPIRYWQNCASRQNQYPGNSESALKAETVTIQSALTKENVQNSLSSIEATSTFHENNIVRNQPASSGANYYQRRSSNEPIISYQEMYMPRRFQHPVSGNSSASQGEAITGQSASTSQGRCASNEPTTSLGDTYEPMHYNVRVSRDSESHSVIEISESSNSPQSYSSPREHSNERNQCRVTSTNISVSEGDNESCTSLSSSEEMYEKWNEDVIKEDTYELPQHTFSNFFIGPRYIDNIYEYGKLFGVDPGVYPTMCYPSSGQLYDMGTPGLATNVSDTEWNINN